MNWLTLDTARLIHGVSAALIAMGVITLYLPGGRHLRLAGTALALGAAGLAGEAAVRTLLTGRAPFIGTYENTLIVAALVAAASVICLTLVAPSARLLLVRLTAPWALVALLYGSRFAADPLPIGAEGRGLLAYAHALVGWLDFTVLLVGTMAAVGMLVSRRGDTFVWQSLVTRMLGAGFALLTATMASGALLSFAAFGSWYQWQIAETLAAALWLVYGFLLHAYLLFGWRDRRLALLVVVVLPLTLAAFWSWSLYSGTYHYFERILGS